MSTDEIALDDQCPTTGRRCDWDCGAFCRRAYVGRPVDEKTPPAAGATSANKSPTGAGGACNQLTRCRGKGEAA